MPTPLARIRRWLHGRRPQTRTRVWREGAGWVVDVRGQTCPGYLLEINRAVADIGAGARIDLLVSYPPCGEDVRVWCAEKGHVLKEMAQTPAGHFRIAIISGAAKS